jgi:anti-sigma-K factor RskA
MTVPSIEELERQLSALPPEAWDRPVPPPPPWPVDRPDPRRVRSADPAARAWRRRLRRAPSTDTSPRRRLLVLRPLRAALASVALLAAGLGAGLLIGRGEDPALRGSEPPRGVESLRVQLEPVGDRGRGAAGAVTLAGRAGGSASVRLTGLRPNRGGDFYEVWLLGDDGELVSLGSVRVPASGRAELRVQLPVDPGRFRYLDISREPADGDPGHSTDSVLRGPTRQ